MQMVFKKLHVIASGLESMHKYKKMAHIASLLLIFKLNFSEKLLIIVVDLLYDNGLRIILLRFG